MPARAADAPPVLAPGKSLTVLDLGDPFVRLVITAPASAPVDLSPLLHMKEGDSVRSVPTRLQVRESGGLTRNADGSVSLGAPTPVTQPGMVLHGGVLVFNAGKWAYHPNAGPVPGAPAPTPDQVVGRQISISRPGASPEQTARDIAQCRDYAEKSSQQFSRAQDRGPAFNATQRICLRTFGYDIGAAP
jgi:hypothetical protein